MNQPPSLSATHTAHILLTFGAVLLIGLGLVIISLVANGLELGLLICLVGAGLFTLGTFRSPGPRVTRLIDRLHLTPGHILFGVSICLSALTVFTNHLLARQVRFDFSLTWLLWFATIGSVLGTFAVWPIGGVRDWFVTHRRELMGIGLVTLLGAILRFYQLGQIPRVIDGDEGLHGMYALSTNRGDLSNPFSMLGNIGSLYLYAIDAAVQLFGRTPFALRFVPAVAGSLAVPATYLLARQLFSQRVALFSALLLAVSHAHLHFSRIVSVPYILGSFLIPLTLFFFSRALLRRSSLSAALGGLGLAVHFSSYVDAQIVTALLIIYCVILVLARQPMIRQGWRQVAVFWSSAVIIALPQIAYDVNHPDQFLTRLNSDGLVQSGWLATEMANTGRSVFHVLADRVAHVFLSLIYYPAVEFYGSAWPVLETLTAGLFILGMLYALLRTRDRHFLLLNGYFWAIIVAIGLFSIPPGADSYRVLAALPAAVIMAGLALDQIVLGLRLDQPGVRPLRIGLLVSVFVAAFWLNTYAYFQDFAGRCRFGGDVSTRFASYFGNYLRTLDRETTVYLLSSDEARYGVHPSVDFLSGKKPVTNVDGPADNVKLGPDTVVVTSPLRIGELEEWISKHPGGKLHNEYDCNNLILLAYSLP